MTKLASSLLRVSPVGVLLRVAAPALLLTLAAGCDGDVGDRCEVNSDCDDGLTCVSTSAFEGTCQPSVQADGAVPTDTASPTDTATPTDTAGDTAAGDASAD